MDVKKDTVSIDGTKLGVADFEKLLLPLLQNAYSKLEDLFSVFAGGKDQDIAADDASKIFSSILTMRLLEMILLRTGVDCGALSIDSANALSVAATTVVIKNEIVCGLTRKDQKHGLLQNLPPIGPFDSDVVTIDEALASLKESLAQIEKNKS